MIFKDKISSIDSPELPAIVNSLQHFQNNAIEWFKLKDPEIKKENIPKLRTQYYQLLNIRKQRDESISKKKDIHLSEAESDKAFAEGVLRALEYQHSIIGKNGIHDGFGSKTLAFFETDFIKNKAHRNKVEEALRETLRLSYEEFKILQEDFHRHELQPLQDRQKIIEAIDQLFPAKNNANIHHLFKIFYPAFNLPSTLKISRIQSASSLFFCVPFSTLSNFSKKNSKNSDDPLVLLWSEFRKQTQRDMAHFPVFGFFSGEDVASTTIHAIAKTTKLSPQKCREYLSSMISILAAEDVDKYIIHDIWGHQWQANLFQFEDTYQDTSTFNHLPRLLTNTPELTQIISEGIRSQNEKEWKANTHITIRALLEKRLIHSISALFAEVLADSVEFKFLDMHPELAGHMPSSSFLKDRPTKLDLTLHDLPLYIRFAFRALRQYIHEDSQPEILRYYKTEFPGIEAYNISNVVNKVIIIIRDEIENNTNFSFEINSKNIKLNAHAKLAIQFFEIAETYNTSFLDPILRETQSAIFPRHFDLLAFTTASFYEQNREENFWKITHFLKYDFEPRFIAFQKTLNDRR